MTDTTTEARRDGSRAVFARQLKLLETGGITEWVALFHPDGVLEFPYAPPGFPREVRGTEAIHAHMRNFPEQLDVTFSGVVHHDTVDPELVVAEFEAVGTALVSGRPFRQRYVSLLWLRDGRITRYRDYWNPLAVLAAIGGPDTFRELFADPAAGG
ncbi:nuclear transport factor 2 family protein [Micromonospora sp. WMMD882]|uniref:nuclear transport factor 2 family protein n=1 Tax=Micromonospora sp. WMMD882 TaxID=3015151 RepID=UPI00248C9618|nr:nuclear transport factor 2 family protein [Micromonospora sp. WMMD882]WBB80298.1 nuclear transport factor 2 family protein [Micromonospora sp. WMMD882]